MELKKEQDLYFCCSSPFQPPFVPTGNPEIIYLRKTAQLFLNLPDLTPVRQFLVFMCPEKGADSTWLVFRIIQNMTCLYRTGHCRKSPSKNPHIAVTGKAISCVRDRLDGQDEMKKGSRTPYLSSENSHLRWVSDKMPTWSPSENISQGDIRSCLGVNESPGRRGFIFGVCKKR